MNTKKYNYGISLLKAIMSFEVVCCHFWLSDKVDVVGLKLLIAKLCYMAVPVFMIVSFYFTAKSSNDNFFKPLLKRIKRIAIPYFTWPLIIWFIYLIIDRACGTMFACPLYRLKFNYIWGWGGTISQLYYLEDLLIATIVFSIVGFLLKRFQDYFYIVLMIIFWVLQYTGKYLFIMPDPEREYSVGFFVELMPFACIGMLLGNNNILEKIKKKWDVCLVLSLSLAWFLLYNDVFQGIVGYGYQGIDSSLIGLLLVMMFYVIPFEKLPIKIDNMIAFLGKYSLGIYLLHYFVGTLLNEFYFMPSGKEYNTFNECILIWILSFILSFLISLIPGKFSKALVE